MSFSNEVRNEIISSINDKDKRYACMYGMLLFSRTLSRKKIRFQSENQLASDNFENLLNTVFHGKIKYQKSISERKSGGELHIFDITDEESISEILEYYKIDCGNEPKINYDLIANNSFGVFLAGVFLACGSVSDPQKEYHLEFVAPQESLANDLLSLLEFIEVHAKMMKRRKQNVVYVKESESIEDTITFIGAPMCTLELMDVKVVKSMRNRLNRSMNCEYANLDKTIDAAIRQLRDIQLIADTDGLESLSDELREVAELRIENTEMSLQEIGESLEVPISRSGVNHRFRKISKIADDIRSRGEKADES